MKEGRFIYCVIERGAEAFPSCLSPSDGRPVFHWTGSKVTGLEGAKLETVSYGEVEAVVSPLRMDRFDQLQEEAVKESIAKYQEVNNRIFASRTVVPVRFGTVADDPAEVRELLEKVYLQVKAALKRLAGKIELVVRASWDPQVLIDEIKDEVTNGKLGAVDLQEKIAIGKRVFEAVQARKKNVTETVHRTLCPLALDSSLGGRPEREEMIFDRSYLVERRKEGLFDEAVNRVANKYRDRLTFKYIGPLPPYSFTRLEISQGNFEVVHEAIKTLGLSERASLEEIRTRYIRLSLVHHPDRNPDDPGAEERFRNIAGAYEILTAYCQNNRRLEEDGTYSFTKKDVETAVTVRDAYH